jgi:probable O-glycosylation ligase (exosortase A-associated)
MAVTRNEARVLAGAAQPSWARGDGAVGNWAFSVLLAYACVEFVRPQDVLPVLGVARPALLLAAVLTFYWLRTWGLRELVADRLLVLFLLFSTLACAWIPFAVNNYWALQASKTLVMLLFASSVPLGLMLIQPRRRVQFFTLWIAAHVYLGLYSVTHDGRGPGSFVRDENDFALALCMGLTYPYFLAQQKGIRPALRMLYYGAVLAMLAGIVWTGSRGGFVGLVCVAGYMFWLSRNKVRNLVVLLVLGAITFQFVPDSYVERIQTISDNEDGSRNERLLHWRIGWEMFADNPVLGVGPQNYPYHAGRYQVTLPDYQEGEKMLGGRAAHSLWFVLLPEFGLVGTVLFLSIVLGLMLRLKSTESKLTLLAENGDAEAETDVLLAKAMRASIIAYLTAGTFISVLYHPHVGYLIGFVLALSRSTDQKTAAAAKSPPAQAGSLAAT